jgi:hypothetical protein
MSCVLDLIELESVEVEVWFLVPRKYIIVGLV